MENPKIAKKLSKLVCVCVRGWTTCLSIRLSMSHIVCVCVVYNLYTKHCMQCNTHTVYHHRITYRSRAFSSNFSSSFFSKKFSRFFSLQFYFFFPFLSPTTDQNKQTTTIENEFVLTIKRQTKFHWLITIHSSVDQRFKCYQLLYNYSL